MTATTPASSAPRLTRQTANLRRPAPVRMLHLGLGNFFRAHQAWYTDRAPDAAEWGIAAFTGRSAQLADALQAQQGAYSLITRAPSGDTVDVIGSLASVHPGTDHHSWLGIWADPRLAVVTLTVTEAGYRRGRDGRLDLDDPEVRTDIQALRSGDGRALRTVPARLAAGLAARRQAGGTAVSLLSCDNLPNNGAALEQSVSDMLQAVDPSLASWAGDHARYGNTMVDRITPATTDVDRMTVLERIGVVDAVPVSTEPFSEWVIAAEFPHGRPDWEAAGARIVTDVTPFEERKLWLLNGAHSLLAYAGSARGYTTVADANADPLVRGWVEQWWDEACRHLSLPESDLSEYRSALLERFDNSRIRHNLAQIAADGSQKLPVRVVPTIRAEVRDGRVPTGALRVVSAWVAHLRGHGAPVRDADTAVVSRLSGGTEADCVRAVLDYLVPDVSADGGLARRVSELVAEVTVGTGGAHP